jgi:hypothetical protein
MSNLYVWMILDYDIWHNQHVSHGILIKFIQNQFK